MFSKSLYKSRLEKVFAEMEQRQIECLLVFNKNNQFYITGSDVGSCTLVIKDEEPIQIVYLLEKSRAKLELKLGETFTISSYPLKGLEELFVGQLHEAIGHILEEREIKNGKVGIEASSVTYSTYIKISETLKGYSLVDASSIISELRKVKGNEELELIKKAIKASEEAMKIGIESCTEGTRECEVAAKIEASMKSKGFGIAFETIVASGRRSALPHGFSSTKKLKRGDLVVLDLGAKYEHYCSDMTRTISVGDLSSEQRRLIEQVMEAQSAAIERIEPGVKVSEVDLEARKVLEKYGLSKYFIHSLGHGVGLAVHEPPTLSPNSKDELKVGMVFTVEPGVYIEDIGGVRIEDIVLVTEKGAKLLTSFERLIV